VEIDLQCLVSVTTASLIVGRLQPTNAMVQADVATTKSENRAGLPTREHDQSTP
jgi:hypothetical protein